MDTESPVQAATNLAIQMGAVRAELEAFLRRRAPGHYEEIAQDTWLRITKANPQCANQSAFRAYAFTVARRLLIDHYRRHQVSPSLVALDETVPIPGNDDPHSYICVAEVITVVNEELATMKPEIAEVFRWRVTEQLPFREIATRQGVSINTALGRMHYATKRLSAALHKAGWSQGGGK